jgi:hypothetical protein
MAAAGAAVAPVDECRVSGLLARRRGPGKVSGKSDQVVAMRNRSVAHACLAGVIGLVVLAPGAGAQDTRVNVGSPPTP